MSEFDVAIVGAGAAGLMAAIFAARTHPGLRVVALDGAKRVGAKILISGGGRCNVTNRAVEASDFNGSSRNAIARVLRTFDVAATVEFFEAAGAHLKVEESGKLFPTTDRASTVLDALFRACDVSGATIRSGVRVLSIIPQAGKFELATAAGTIGADTVILAAGGKSVPKTGSDGAGYDLARTLGHSIVAPFPALVPLLLPKGHWMTALSGVAVDSGVRVTAASGAVLYRTRGSVLLTHFGLSGPAILDASRHWIAARRAGAEPQLRIALAPASTFEALDAEMVAASQSGKRETLGSFLRGFTTDRLAAAIAVHECATPPETLLTRLSRDARRIAARALVDLAVPVTGDRGFDYAEVTAGGVPLAEIDTRSMESRKTPRLFVCGEVVDVDGRIGGFNFQWAWASGRLAGINAARALAAGAGSPRKEPPG